MQTEASTQHPGSRPVVTDEARKTAEALYWEGYTALKDNEDSCTAAAKFRQVMDAAPDPDFEYYKKAQQKLKDMGRS